MFCRATLTSLLATASKSWRYAAGHARISATVWRDNLSIGSGSITDNKPELAIHRSGTAGRDLTCCGVEAPSRPASRSCSGRFAGVTRRGIITGEISALVSMSMDDSGISWGGDNSIKLPSDETSSQSATASLICTSSDFGCTDVTRDRSNISCNASTDALKNLLRGACSVLLVCCWCAVGDYVRVSQLLTRPARQRHVHPNGLAGGLPLIEKLSAAEPFYPMSPEV